MFQVLLESQIPQEDKVLLVDKIIQTTLSASLKTYRIFRTWTNQIFEETTPWAQLGSTQMLVRISKRSRWTIRWGNPDMHLRTKLGSLLQMGLRYWVTLSRTMQILCLITKIIQLVAPKREINLISIKCTWTIYQTANNKTKEVSQIWIIKPWPTSKTKEWPLKRDQHLETKPTLTKINRTLLWRTDKILSTKKTS